MGLEPSILFDREGSGFLGLKTKKHAAGVGGLMYRLYDVLRSPLKLLKMNPLTNICSIWVPQPPLIKTFVLIPHEQFSGSKGLYFFRLL